MRLPLLHRTPQTSKKSVPLEQQLHDLISQNKTYVISHIIFDYSPFEVAMACYRLTIEEAKLILLETLPPRRSAMVLREFETPFIEKLIPQIESVQLARITNEMDLDDAADFIIQLPFPKRIQVFGRLPQATKKALEPLFQYPPNKAGGMMDPRVLAVHLETSIDQAIVTIRQFVDNYSLEYFYAVYIIDAENQLVGRVAVSKLLLADQKALLSSLVEPDLHTVFAHTDEKEIVQLFREHDLFVLPVVDQNNRLLGRITVDDVVEVIIRQHDEDLAHFSGTAAQHGVSISLWKMFLQRLPWLSVALIGEFLLAVMLQNHQEVFVNVPSIAMFIALILAMGGNTGIQSTTLIVRELASGEIRFSGFWVKLGREIVVALGLGLVFGGVLVIGGWALTQNVAVGMAVGIATLLNIMVSMTIGVITPLAAKRLQIDPAVASGPFLTTANDILGMVIYLLVIYWLIV